MRPGHRVGQGQPRLHDRSGRRGVQRRLARVTGVKIRDPQTLRRLAVAASAVARVWYRTLSYAYRPLTAYLLNGRPELLGNARYIYAFWHEYLFVPSYVYARPDTAVLIGLHRDGELLTHINES